jgi:hypothetical protein
MRNTASTDLSAGKKPPPRGFGECERDEGKL